MRKRQKVREEEERGIRHELRGEREGANERSERRRSKLEEMACGVSQKDNEVEVGHKPVQEVIGQREVNLQGGRRKTRKRTEGKKIQRRNKNRADGGRTWKRR